MTDSSLQSLYPVNQIGADGFNWWIGQIEKDSRKDPKGSGRCKVRIIGLHPQSCQVVKDDDLPWAITMMPVTNPHRPGARFSVTPKLRTGDWVVGFFMDNDKQQPCIIGSVGRTAASTNTKTSEKETAEEGCNSFTTFIDPERMAADQPAGDKEMCPVSAVDAGHAQDGIERSDSPARSTSLTNIQASKLSPNSATNPGGISFCIEKADTCGKETNLSGTFTTLFSEMLAEIQNNDGKLGTYLVGKLSGELMDAVDVGRSYVNKAIRIIKTFVANIKGFVIKQIKKAVKKITDAILRPSEDGNVLTPITKFLNDMLAKVGCKMADLGDRLAKWLEDMIFGFLFNIFKSTACQVDKFVGGLLNKIQSLMNDLLNDILGPLQDILGAIAAPLNMIGDAINYVLKLLGIECTGPGQKCSKTTKVCTDCGSDKREDFLDRLLKDLEGWGTGQDWNQYNCEDTKEGLTIEPTSTSFVGGIQTPSKLIVYSINDITVLEGEQAEFTITRTGRTDMISSVSIRTRSGTATEGTDFEQKNGIVGFVSGEKSKTVQVRTFADSEQEGQEDFFLRIFPDSPGSEMATSQLKKNVGRCVIKESTITTGTSSEVNPDTGLPTSSNPNDSVSNPNEDPFTGNVTIPTGTVEDVTLPTYNVTPNKITVKEGDFVTYTITTTNVPNGTALTYRLFGPKITPSDVVSNNLSGTFFIENNQAVVIVGINEDGVTEDEETLIFAIPGTGASASVLIESDIAGLNEEEIAAKDDLSSEVSVPEPLRLPTTGDIITDIGGGIITIPISSSGDPYSEPPAVFITGNGYGASGEVLLDNNGFAKEIRVVDPGFGYKINIPAKAGKECIIDSFTMIRPGREYESAPTVFVNGSKDVADAVINTDGQVISVRIRDRSTTFTEYPEIKILGGGGYGSKFIPSFVCLDPDDRVNIGSAKVGTGSYIDCP